MVFHNLTKIAEFRRAGNAVAAGSTDSNGTGIDMRGYDGITFIVAFGTITATAVTGIKVQQSDDNGSSDDYTDLTGSAQSVADTDSNKIVVTEVFRPTKRYVRVVVTRATANAVIDGIFAILTRPQVGPPLAAHSTLVRLPECFNSPAEGTA